jgi:ribonuclease HI
VPAQVWSSANPPFLSNQIPEEEDGVQISLSFFFQNDITEHDLCNKMFLLWYIWKARNDNRFQRKTWSANQIKLAAAAHMNAHLEALQNPVSPPLQDISLYTNNTSAGTEQRSFQTTDPFLVSFPSSFAGTRCYTDAATLPDNHTSGTRQAGLKVFIINTDENPPTSIFIKALLQESSSVLMAESTTLALATNVLNQIQCRRYTIFSDNQHLVHFLNKSNLSNPPDLRIKPYSQSAANLLANYNTQVRRIKRTQNQMADSLARQAFQAITSNQIQYDFSCSNPSHANDCPLLRAINSVTITFVNVLSALCC